MPATAFGGLAKIACNTVVSDSHGYWSTANARYVPQRAGRYLVTGSFVGNIAGANSSLFDLAIYKNGSSLVEMNRVPGSSTYGPAQSITAQVACNGSTDYIELWGGHGGGGFAITGSETLEICCLKEA